ncbi:MAG: hypothetical protein KJ623_04230 [Nanoarchaeota archaeon]|nr:hypothetical protein [Nanoarchaeota archaeon]MBU0962577.1 hypothetical protein [Nanoarchaeota archaeon]
MKKPKQPPFKSKYFKLIKFCFNLGEVKEAIKDLKRFLRGFERVVKKEEGK